LLGVLGPCRRKEVVVAGDRWAGVGRRHIKLLILAKG